MARLSSRHLVPACEPLPTQHVVGQQVRARAAQLSEAPRLAADELVELLPDAGLSEEAAGELIMAARAHWFGDEAPGVTEGDAEVGAEADPAAEAEPAANAEDNGARA